MAQIRITGHAGLTAGVIVMLPSQHVGDSPASVLLLQVDFMHSLPELDVNRLNADSGLF